MRQNSPSRRPRFVVALLAPVLLLPAGCGTSPAAAPSPAPSATAVSAAVAPLPPHGLRPADVPTVVATVNGVPVPTWLYLSQVNFHLALAEGGSAPGKPGTPVSSQALAALERQALGAVVDDALVTAYGTAHGWAPSDRLAAAEYARVVQRRGGIDASLRQVAGEYLTPAHDRIVARHELIAQQVFDHFLAGLRQPVSSVQYRMIVVPSRGQALTVRRQLASTADWVDLAAHYSIDPAGRIAGGEQSLLTHGSGDPALARVVFGLPEGTLSAPVHLTQGWAILQVMQRLPSSNLLRGDVQRYQAWVHAQRAHAHITSYIRLG